MKIANEIKELLNEGTFDLPFKASQAQKLSILFKKPIPVKSVGDSGPGLRDIIGDDDLFDLLSEIEDQDGGDTDARPPILNFVKGIVNKFKKDPKGFKQVFDPKAIKILKALKVK